jgi:alkylation response protein AidB-like acyl-CoA dehydrogenase
MIESWYLVVTKSFKFFNLVAHTSTHAVVMARLITGGRDHGIHAFIVQLRSLEDHSVLPGTALFERRTLDNV